jgi:hypothetical protein
MNKYATSFVRDTGLAKRIPGTYLTNLTAGTSPINRKMAKWFDTDTGFRTDALPRLKFHISRLT